MKSKKAVTIDDIDWIDDSKMPSPEQAAELENDPYLKEQQRRWMANLDNSLKELGLL